MAFPIEDTGFKLWHADLDTQLKRIHGVTARDLGLELRSLQTAYYGGTSVLAALQVIVAERLAA